MPDGPASASHARSTCTSQHFAPQPRPTHSPHPNPNQRIPCPSQEDGDDPATGSSWRPGGASLLWLQLALSSLDQDLVRRYGPGASIVYKRGPYAEALRQVAAAVGAYQVYYTRRYEPAAADADARVEASLATSGFQLHSFSSFLLREPWEVRVDMPASAARGVGSSGSGQGRQGKASSSSSSSNWVGHFGSLSPFLKAHQKLGRPQAPLPEPRKVPVAADAPAQRCGGLRLEELGLYHSAAATPVITAGATSSPSESTGAAPSTSGAVVVAGAAGSATVPDWGAPIRQAWRADESEALHLLDEFLSRGLSQYETRRGVADGGAVSRLSPYLHWGQLSPRLMWHKLEQAK